MASCANHVSLVVRKFSVFSLSLSLSLDLTAKRNTYDGTKIAEQIGKNATEGNVKVNLAFYVATSRYSVAPKQHIGHRVVSYLFRTISLLQVAPVDYLQLPLDSTIDVGSVLEL